MKAVPGGVIHYETYRYMLSLRSSFKTILDIGANFPDAVFKGIYHGKKCHADDFTSMLKRCRQVNLTCVMSTSTSEEDYLVNS